ncbi:MAG: rhodanese-like domain-containing protein, partial [Chloroflexi bacterium]|nr:rhodanese-like domain-containing protein [Chloroflexota bacterium]
FLLSLTACQSQATTTPAPVPTPTLDTQAYWNLVQQTQDAYAAAEYQQALDLARQAIVANPDDNTAWELFRQASIAAVADDYLTNLPSHRYRLPVERFLQDRVNHARDWFLIDVRTPEEFAKGHIDGAINIPLRQLLHHLDQLPSSKTAPILIYCHSQKRSTHAMLILHELGYSKAYHLEGGYAAYQDWISHNPLPTPGPTPTPSPDEPDFGC